jgi:hypothetical protein
VGVRSGKAIYPFKPLQVRSEVIPPVRTRIIATGGGWSVQE